MTAFVDDFNLLAAFTFEDLLYCCPCKTTSHLVCLIVISVLSIDLLRLLKQIIALLWIVISWKRKV